MASHKYPTSSHLVHHRLRDDGTLLPDLWEAVDADNAADAIKRVLERPENKGLMPEVVYVSKGSLRHPDGTPCIVTRYKLQWGGKR